jgi:hypothetical protein
MTRPPQRTDERRVAAGHSAGAALLGTRHGSSWCFPSSGDLAFAWLPIAVCWAADLIAASSRSGAVHGQGGQACLVR